LEKSESIRVGIAGAGFMGNVHSRSLVLAGASSISEDIKPELVVIADPDRDRADQVADRYGWQDRVESWRGMLDYDLDLIFAALPNSEHMPFIESASNQKAAVLLEKPLASSITDARQMVDMTAEREDIRTGYMHRFLPAVQNAKTFIDDGGLGDIRAVRSVYLLNMRKADGHADWRFDKDLAGNGASEDLGSHHIDLVQFLVGNVASVQALTRTLDISGAPDATNDDMVASLLEIEGGAIGTMQASRVSVGHPLTGYVEIDGDKGSLRVDRSTLNDFIFRDEDGLETRKAVRPSEPFSTLWSSATVQGAHPFSWHDSFAFQAAEMLQIARGDTPETVWSASMNDALQASEVVEAMAESSMQGRRVPVKQYP